MIFLMYENVQYKIVKMSKVSTISRYKTRFKQIGIRP